MGFLFRPTNALQSSIAASQAAINFHPDRPGSEPVVGVHIRHGDKPSEGGAVVALQPYLDHARSMITNNAKRHPVVTAEARSHHHSSPQSPSASASAGSTEVLSLTPPPVHVFITTDDVAITNEIHTLQKQRIALEQSLTPDPTASPPPLPLTANQTAEIRAQLSAFPVLYVYDQDRSLMPQSRGGQALVRSLGSLQRSDARKSNVLLDVLEDWLTLAQCQAGFIGTYSSNFGCVAYLLANWYHTRREHWTHPLYENERRMNWTAAEIAVPVRRPINIASAAADETDKSDHITIGEDAVQSAMHNHRRSASRNPIPYFDPHGRLTPAPPSAPAAPVRPKGAVAPGDKPPPPPPTPAQAARELAHEDEIAGHSMDWGYCDLMVRAICRFSSI